MHLSYDRTLPFACTTSQIQLPPVPESPSPLPPAWEVSEDAITFPLIFSWRSFCFCCSSSSSRWDLQVIDSFLMSRSISRHCSSLCSVSNCLKRRQSLMTPLGPEEGKQTEKLTSVNRNLNLYEACSYRNLRTPLHRAECSTYNEVYYSIVCKNGQRNTCM